eukprot:4872296-Pyramimonas_sp.AAC.1
MPHTCTGGCNEASIAPLAKGRDPRTYQCQGRVTTLRPQPLDDIHEHGAPPTIDLQLLSMPAPR